MYVDQNLYHGRPVSGQRLDKELRCYDLLDRLGLAYDRADHDAADTIEACAAVEQVLGAGICKNLFLTNRQQTAFYLLLMPGHKPFRTKDLSHQIGSARLSFASPEHMLELLDIAPGSVSVLGLMNDHDGRVRLLIDRDLLQDAYLCCHAQAAHGGRHRRADPGAGARTDVCGPAGVRTADLKKQEKNPASEDAGFFVCISSNAYSCSCEQPPTFCGDERWGSGSTPCGADQT